MTVSNQTLRNQYTANGTNTVFSYGFKIYAKTDILVYIDGVLKTVDTDYSVSGLESASGGNVTFTVAPSANTTVTLVQNSPLTQGQTYNTTDDFPAASHEAAMDKLTLQNQRQQDALNRSIKVPAYTISSFDASLPDIEGKGEQFIRLKSDETGFEFAEASGVGGGDGIVSVDGVDNAGGNIDLVAGSNITITPDNIAKTITFTASSTGIASVNSVSNNGGNIDLVAGTGMTVTGDDALNQITLSCSAPASIDGVSNAGGNIDLVAGTAITITPNDAANTITIATTAQNNTASNQGGGTGLFKQKTSSDLEFKTISAGNGIDITSGTDTITMAVDANDINLTDLGDVVITTPTHGQVLKYDTVSGGWKNDATGALSAALNDLTDVTITSPANGAVLQYDTVSSSWIDATIAGGVSNLDDLADVTISGAANGEVLTYNGTGWVNDSAGALTAALDDLTDVTISGASKADELYYSGTGWKNLAASVFNVKKYGAVGDGSTNDATAIQAAIDAAEAAGGGVVYFPESTYALTTGLTTTEAVHLKGDGKQLSILKWTSAGGITHTGGSTATPTGRKPFMATGITFVAAFAGGATCLDLNFTVVSGSVSPLVEIRDCEFTRDGTGNLWDRAIDMENARDTIISQCHFRGLQTSRTMEGIRINGANDPTSHRITDCMFYFLNIGLEVGGTVEGVYVNCCDFVAVNTGVRWNTTGGEPLLGIINSHFSTYNYNLRLTNCIQAMFQNNLFYERSDTSATNTAIQFESGCDDCLVQGNIFRGFSANNFNTIVVASGSSDIHIHGNSFTNAATGVNFQAGSSTNSCLDNDFNSSTIQNILDNGTNDVIRLLGGNISFRGALATRTSAQSVSNSTWTAVQYQSEVYDTSGIFDAGSPTRMTVPSGVTKVRVAANVNWQGSAAGQRQITIRKNGVSFGDSTSSAYQGQPNQGTGSAGSGNQNIVSPVLSVTAGDYFECEVFQDSGGALNVAHSNTKAAYVTWLSLEIIE